VGRKQEETQHSNITRFAWSLMESIVRGQVQIHNRTGEPLKCVTHHDYKGQVEPPYPAEISPGQLAEFPHHGSVGNPSQSIGAVVYRCKNPAGQECDWMMSWLNKYGDASRKASSKPPFNSLSIDQLLGFELI